MKKSRCIWHALLLLCIFPATNGAIEHTAGASRHLWRGEYDRAAAGTQDENGIDRAAVLTLAGDAGSAADILGTGGDELRMGFVAFHAGRYKDAARLLRNRSDNSFVEAYRLFYRARSLVFSGRRAEAREDLGSVLTLARPADSADRHPVTQRAANLLIEVWAEAEECGESPRLAEIDPGLLTGKSFFIIARHNVGRGAWEEAREAVLAGLATSPDTGAAGPLAGITADFLKRFDAFSLEELKKLTRWAIGSGAEVPARNVLSHLRERYPSDYDVRYLLGRYLSMTGKTRRALDRFSRLFKSQAPVSIKKDSLLRIASLEYKLGRHSRAAESYRLFGMYYPDDPRSVMALDTAARIHVARSRWIKALTLWNIIQQRGIWTVRAREALLSSAVLRDRLGQRTEAHRILETLLPRCSGTLRPAALYWLQRTSADSLRGAAYRDELLELHSRSFHAGLVREGAGMFRLDETAENTGGYLARLENLESIEHELFGALASVNTPADTLFTDPAFAAFDYFLRCGLRPEASECCTYLENMFGGDRPKKLALYRKCRSHGFVGLALSILNGVPPGREGETVIPQLRFPVAYVGTIGEHSAEHFVPPDLVLAVIREESVFDVDAVSRAGARGLMQIMPATGLWIARKLGRKHATGDVLFTASSNIETGVWYLRFLLDRCDGSIVGTLAAYNAGASRMKGWRETFDPSVEPAGAIELIGPRETRTYVRRVLNTFAVYRSMWRG